VCEGNVSKSGTTTAADEAVNAEAATKHTRNQRGTHEGNATILMKVVSMKLYQRKNLYILVKKKESSKTYTGTNVVSMKLQEKRNTKRKCE